MLFGPLSATSSSLSEKTAAGAAADSPLSRSDVFRGLAVPVSNPRGSLGGEVEYEGESLSLGRVGGGGLTAEASVGGVGGSAAGAALTGVFGFGAAGISAAYRGPYGHTPAGALKSSDPVLALTCE